MVEMASLGSGTIGVEACDVDGKYPDSLEVAAFSEWLELWALALALPGIRFFFRRLG
jgi:hypothetical protein